MQASQATFQEGAFKPKQQDKRNELSIQTAGKKETSSRDTTEIETTFCRDLPPKKSASSTAEQGKVNQGLPNEKLMNQAHEPGNTTQVEKEARKTTPGKLSCVSNIFE